MTDEQITDLLFERSERGLEEIRNKYGSGLQALALRLLGNPEDAEEIVNETYLAAWDRIPPLRPESLKAFLFAVCRRRALDRLDSLTRIKRGGGELPLVLEELEETLPSGSDGREWAGAISLRETLEQFLRELSARDRVVFLRRYWYGLSVKETAKSCGISENHCKILLYRLRTRLKQRLEQEGVWHE